MQLLKWKQEYWMQYVSLTMVSHLIVCLFHSQNLHDNFFLWTDDKSSKKPKPIKFSEEENEESPDSSDDIPSSISKLKRRLLKCTPTRPPSVPLTEPRMTPVTQLQKTCTPRDVLLTGQEWHVWYSYSYDSQQIICLMHAQAHKNSGHETSQPLWSFTLLRGTHLSLVSAWYTNYRAFVVSHSRCTTPPCWIERDALGEDKQSK